MMIGFSTGAFHKHLRIKEALKLIKETGCPAVELGLVKLERFWSNQIEELTTEDLKDFQYVSLHAPKYDYGNDVEETERIFQRMSVIHQLRPLDMVVFHPDTIVDFKPLTQLEFPVGMENMDHRKLRFRNVREMEELLSRYPSFGLVLDVNHVFTNDPTMQLAREFYKQLGTRIVQIQASGYQTLHDPLFQTNQREILEAIEEQNVPIIDEGLLDPNDIHKELTYIQTTIQTTLSGEN